jgi:hypothetical protein
MKRGALIEKLFVFYAALFGSMQWLFVVPALFGPNWRIGDVGIWRGGWHLMLTGHGNQLYSFASMKEEFRTSGVLGHSELNAWVLPPQHGFAFAPLGNVEPRTLYALILCANIGAWWWTLRSVGTFVCRLEASLKTQSGTQSGTRSNFQFWTPQRVVMMKCVGWLFGPAALSGVFGAFPCLVIAALWKVVVDSLERDTERSQDRRSRFQLRQWMNAVLLLGAAVKPQMVLLICVALFVHSRSGRGIVIRAGVLFVASSAALWVRFGTGLFKDWFSMLSAYNAGKFGVPRFLWTSPIPILTDTLSGAAPARAIAAALLILSVTAVAVGPVLLRRNGRPVCSTASPLLTAFLIASTLTYCGASYLSLYDTVVLFPAVAIALTFLAQGSAPFVGKLMKKIALLAAVVTIPLNMVFRFLPFAQAREIPMVCLLTLCAVCGVGLRAKGSAKVVQTTHGEPLVDGELGRRSMVSA